MNRRFFLAAGFAAALSLMAGPAVTAHAADYNGPKIKFRVAHTTPPGNHITLAFEKFKELVGLPMLLTKMVSHVGTKVTLGYTRREKK